jgi:ActR/RegA family two-component response regulator
LNPGGGHGSGARYHYTLVVGPDTEDRAWVEGVLMRGGLEVAAATEPELMAMPDIVPPSLVVLDDSGAKPERMASFRNVGSHAALVGVPVLVLAYDADIDSFSEAITRGAAAYLVKPANSEELVAVAHKLSGWLGGSDRTEKRRRLRRPLVLKVDVDLRNRGIRVPGQIVDVSGGGCRVELKEPLEKGDLVRVVLHGAEDTTHLTLGAEVRWHRTTPDGVTVAGLRFTGTTALLASKVLGMVPITST